MRVLCCHRERPEGLNSPTGLFSQRLNFFLFVDNKTTRSMFRGVGSDILTPGTPFIYGPGTPQGIISAQRCDVLFLSSTVERIGRS